MLKIKNYKDLKIWQEARDIVKDIYTLTIQFPNEERYGLVAQMRRAAVSIPSNIAEGFSRRHSKEYRQFLHTALGSCAELDTQLLLSIDLSFCTSATIENLQVRLSILMKMVQSLINKL